MSARRLVALLLTGATLAVAGLAARAAAPGRAGAGGAARPGVATLAAAMQATEPPGGGAAAPSDTAVRRPAYATTLPDSAGRGIVERWCLLCHSAMLVTQQAKDSTGWEKTITQMEKWGVVVTPEEHDTLRTYLVRSFGPRVTRATPIRAPAPVLTAGDSTRAPATPR